MKPVDSNPKHADPKLSWEATAQEMAAVDEDWFDWDSTLGDGLDDVSWEPLKGDQVVDGTD